MTRYETVDFSPLENIGADEVITHSLVRDVTLTSGATLALITLDNGRDYRRPNTLGPKTLKELDATLAALKLRAQQGEINAVGITGKQYILAAGADLSDITEIGSRDNAYLLAQLGHKTLGSLSGLGVPSFAFVNGLALGGGLEITLHCDYRTVDASASALALPEVFLGIVPGWGGAFLLPNLIGIENALKVVLSNPLKQNRMMKAPQAYELGIMDAMFSPANFLEDSLAWADSVVTGKITVERKNTPGKIERMTKWPIAIKKARGMLEAQIGTVPKSPYAALELLEKARTGSKEEGFEREDAALADLIASEEFAASMYAFNLVQKRAKKPAGVPDKEQAHDVSKVGIIGAGLMARQFALLFLRKMQVPVVLSDIDQARVDEAVASLGEDIDALHEKGRIDSDTAKRLRALIIGTTDKAQYADCDFVIEAVFEEVKIKQQVLSEVERFVADDAVIATNTSSLSVTEIATALTHPERVIGFHFFNPVAIMPLVEIVATEHSTEQARATGFVVAKSLGKNAVQTRDTPGFVVNRILGKVMGEAVKAVSDGTDILEVEKAFAPLGLPMPPFQLINLVGWKVAMHVQESMARAFPDRFFFSDAFRELANCDEVLTFTSNGAVTGWSKQAQKILNPGSTPRSAADILSSVQDGLADEISRMLDEKVVTAIEDIDLCLILGAGWPFLNGGISAYLDRSGASQRVFGDTFHHPPIRGMS